MPTWIVEPERLEPLPADGEEPAAHDGVGVRRPRVHLAGAVRRRHLVPLERHLPVHQAAQVLAVEVLKIDEETSIKKPSFIYNKCHETLAYILFHEVKPISVHYLYITW